MYVSDRVHFDTFISLLYDIVHVRCMYMYCMYVAHKRKCVHTHTHTHRGVCRLSIYADTVLQVLGTVYSVVLQDCIVYLDSVVHRVHRHNKNKQMVVVKLI